MAAGLFAGAASRGESPAHPASDRRDPRAVAVADAIAHAMAPEDAWQRVGGLRFTFSVVQGDQTRGEYRHLWNVRTGQYRVEGKGRDGNVRVMIFDVNTRKGRAWTESAPPKDSSVSSGGATPEGAAKGGAAAGQAAPGATAPGWVEVSGDALEKAMQGGYGRYINDTYWLMMPLKMKDPGVNLDYDGEKSVDGETYDVVKLTFNGVGLTPGDTYWVYANKKTHLVDRWEYMLEGDAKEAQEKSAAPVRTVWLWKEWKTVGPIKLSMVKTMADGSASIVFKDVEVLAEAPAGAFDPPKP